MGFLGGILSSTKTSLILPSSLIKVDDGAFRNLSCAKGTSLIIGEEKDPSKLDFSRTDDGFGIFN
jgi:hypothetical protein